jgi:hypothetical protein
MMVKLKNGIHILYQNKPFSAFWDVLPTVGELADF